MHGIEKPDQLDQMDVLGSYLKAAGRGLLGLPVGALVNALGAIALGTPVGTQYFLKTISWSLMMSLFTIVPAVTAFGSSWKDWQRIFVNTKPIESLGFIICLPAHGAVIGAWLGAWPMPLDWERPWQGGELMTEEKTQDPTATADISERRKALFEPLEPITNINGRRPSAESLLPPPDFDSASYPQGWLIGKKRKLVNVDVVESMRKIAIQEMNRKDREIDGLNQQLEEDSQCLEHLQLQLLQERSKRAEVERENAMLQEQISMLMNMLQDESMGDEGAEEP